MDKKNGFDKSDLKFIGLNIVAAAVAGLLILVGLIIWLRGYTQHGHEVEVADVKGMYRTEAETVLAAQGLRMQIIDSTYSSKVPFGTIVEQDPKGNSHAKEGRMVYVTVNANGKPQVTLPNLQDMSYRQAETTLRGMGIVVDSVYEYEPSEYRDLVLDVKSDGQSIHPGEKIEIGTRVRLVVGYGRGTEQVEVPNLAGLTLQDARSLLLSKRLTVGAVHYDEKPQEGQVPVVYRQIPGAGERLLEGETVALHLSIDTEKAATSNNDDNDDWF